MITADLLRNGYPPQALPAHAGGNFVALLPCTSQPGTNGSAGGTDAGWVGFGHHRLHLAASISWCAVTRASQPLLWSCRELDVPELESLLSKIAQRIRLGLTAFRAVRIFCSPLASAACSACGAWRPHELGCVCLLPVAQKCDVCRTPRYPLPRHWRQPTPSKQRYHSSCAHQARPSIVLPLTHRLAAGHRAARHSDGATHAGYVNLVAVCAHGVA